MAGIANDVKQIRQALYGREVREAIAHGIEQCYSDVTASKTVADTAAAAANTATQNAQTATQQANQARDNAQAVADGVVNQSITAINDAAAQQRQSVNDLGDQLKSYMSEHYSETITKAEAKANRSSVSTVKHAIGADGQLTLTDALNEPAKKMTIHLEPKQDLHGYDHPWVGGAGKNLLPCNIQSGLVNGVNITVNTNGSITLNGESTDLFYVDLTTDFDSTAMSGMIFTAYTDDIAHTVSTLTFRISKANRVSLQDMVRNGTAINNNGAGLIFALRIPRDQSFTNYVLKPMLRRADEVDESFEPYENICPIEGFDTVDAISTGKNRIAVSNPSDSTTFNGIVFVFNEDGSVFLPGGNTSTTTFTKPITETKIWHFGESVLSGCPSGGSKDTYCLGYYDSTSKDNNWDYGSGCVLQDGVGDHFGRVFIRIYSGYTIPDDGLLFKPMVRDAQTSNSEYEQYCADAISVNLVSSAGSTVYGGTVTVNEDGSGTVTVDKVSYTFDGTESWTMTSSDTDAPFFRTAKDAGGLRYLNPKNWTTNSTGTFSACSLFTQGVVSATNPSPYRYYAYKSGSNDFPYIQVRPSYNIVNSNTASDLSVWKNWLSSMSQEGTPLQIVYEIETPVSYPLTATQLQTLAGTNHILTDGTNIELDYYGDKYCTYEQVMELIANALRS